MSNALQSFKNLVFDTSPDDLRREPRWNLPNDVRISVRCDDCVGQLKNFSRSGISMTLPKHLEPRQIVRVYIGGQQTFIGDMLVKRGLSPILGEVRWAVQAKNGFRHGILIQNLDGIQKQAFEAILGMFST